MRDKRGSNDAGSTIGETPAERVPDVLDMRISSTAVDPAAPMACLFGLSLPEYAELARRVDGGLDARGVGELLERVDTVLKDTLPETAQDLRVRRRALDLLERGLRRTSLETARWFRLTFPVFSYAGIGDFFRRDVREFWTRLRAEHGALFTSDDSSCRILVRWLEIVEAAPARLQDLEHHNQAAGELSMDPYWDEICRAIDAGLEVLLALPLVVDATTELGEDEDPWALEADPDYTNVDHEVDDDEDLDDDGDPDDEDWLADGDADGEACETRDEGIRIRALTADEAVSLAFGCPIAEED